MLHGEVDIDVPDLPESLDGIERLKVRERLGEGAELPVTQLLDDGVLVAEVSVDDGGRVFDRVGQRAHRDAFDAFRGEDLECRVENFLADLRSLALSSLF